MTIKYYATSDTNGKVIAFYNNDVHTVGQIPVTAVEITEGQWQDALSNPRKYRIINGILITRTQSEIDQEIADEEANSPPVPLTDAQKIAALEEENTQLKTNGIMTMEAIAEVYEMLLSLQGGE